ncbi:hypothetical protein [Pseudomonas arsenicoxydans]|uniref:Uncharacterized protein n=1 Tax=Pseudomonas arsenicoxydans TaxID=702115 RepID=A0A4P6G7Y0_9PSED|nr:hypothetical protein [Pseudomonas arsenicoxydans]QAY87277.1 hypothetical protein CUN61_26495 [Pseudomonas arsenicoxydans]
MIDHQQGFATDRESTWSWENPLRRVFFRLLKNCGLLPLLSTASAAQICDVSGQTLTPANGYVVFLYSTDAVNLDPSTEAQGVLRITDDRPLARMAADRMSKMVLRNPPRRVFFRL